MKNKAPQYLTKSVRLSRSVLYFLKYYYFYFVKFLDLFLKHNFYLI